MPAGTLTLTNNSAVVKGAGTAFNTELKAGDFIVSVVGGVTYTLPVKTVDSATQATLIKAYDGPTQAGAAWYAVPREMQNSITAQLVSEATKAMRGMNYDKQNWQQFFTADGDVTITLPDNSQSAGPSAKKLINSVVDKADKTEVDKKANKSDLGDSASRNVGTAAGTVAAGNDGRLNTVGGKSGGQLLGGLGVLNGTAGIDLSKAGTYLLWNEQLGTGISSLVNNPESGGGGFWIRLINSANTVERARFTFSPDSTMTVPQGVYTVNGRVRSFTSVSPTYLEVVVDGSPKGINFFDSDERLKEDIEDVKLGEASGVIKKVRPVSYKFKDTELIKGASHQFGVIAQELEAVLPTAVITLSNGNKALDPLELFGLLLTSNKEMLERIERLEEDIKTLKEK
ncbi:tail fiber domain-containing protein [Serratia liquefaciens]|uniref:tail fiber domain-containing protein n=1 Tax=Serratia liquefaciens TaxID=614 RepID=UPI0021582654|nr:tail fiber domain-containing protein [Serratia liquefaciens]